MAARAKDELQLLSPGRDRARIPPGAGQRLALFPGSFKPPHRGHLAAVQSLLARPDVDRVVIIVSNRCRLLPGTRLVIDASTAAALWRCLTADLPNVAVEIAKHTAIEHALAYFGRVRRGDSLLFCIGENDLAAGDDRFDGVIELRENTGVAAGILTANSDMRATDLRRLLAFGDRGRREFLRALPESMPNGARLGPSCACTQNSSKNT